MSIWNMLSEVMDSNPERYTTQYKNRKGDSWNTAYSGSSAPRSTALHRPTHPQVFINNRSTGSIGLYLHH